MTDGAESLLSNSLYCSQQRVSARYIFTPEGTAFIVSVHSRTSRESTLVAKPIMQVTYSFPSSLECGQSLVAVLNSRIWCAVLRQYPGKVAGSQRDYCVVLKGS